MDMRMLIVFKLGVCVLVASSFVGAQVASPSVDPSKVKFLMGWCSAGEDYRIVFGVVGKEIDLSQDGTAKQVMQMAARFAQEECPRPSGTNNVDATLYAGDPSTFTEDRFNYRTSTGIRKSGSINRLVRDAYGNKSAYGGYGEGEAVWGRVYAGEPIRWGEYSNYAEKQKVRQRQAAAEEARARAEKARNAALLAQQKQVAEGQARARALKTENFLKKAGSKQIVNLGELCQNPFSYVGKVVVFPLRGMWGWDASSPTSAAIRDINNGCEFSMIGVRADLLNRQFNEAKVIAVKVVGKTQGKLVVQYVHHEQCADGRCGDFAGLR